MKKINILDRNIYNRIAAGEVVDRPYSAVKELIENSIDAGATDIEIYVENGGRQLIKIVDNGCGIERDDLPAAFAPHATSKISKVEDLDDVKTLGFRGEALASISAISKVEIVSVTAENAAWKITCDGGNVGQISPAALGKGTVISVRNLFYNTPVRAKFLKTDKKEEADITNFVTRYILGNPSISFKYYVDGELILQSFGGGLDEAVAQVYGAKTLSQCYKIDAEKDGFKVSGFIGNQNFFKPNKTYQSVFLNGRYIVNNTIATAINNAYASYMMKRQFPFYVLNIGVSGDFVDVNVHPNKADVRFIDNRRVFGAVYSVVSSVLDGTVKAADFVVGEKRIPEIKSTSGECVNKIYSQPETAPSVMPYEKISEKPTSVAANDLPQSQDFDPTRDLTFNDYMPKQSVAEMTVTDGTVLPSIENYGLFKAEKEFREKERETQQKIDCKSCKLRGSLFDTYLLYEVGETVYLIDQHAAHERLIYDELRKKMRERNIVRQPMLIPYIFSVNSVEAQFLESNLQLLRSMGFGLSVFGYCSFRVDEVPVNLQDIDIGAFMDEILAQISSLKSVSVEDILKDKIATCACKHAVKGGMRLTEQEVDALFEMLDGNIGLKCPHGRPVCVALAKRDIEKMFKRIV